MPELKRLILIAGICFLGMSLMVIASVFAPLIMGQDPYALLRYVLIRMTAALVAAPFLVGLMTATDYLTPGDWMDAIGNDPKACSYLMSAIVIAIGAILCWA